MEIKFCECDDPECPMNFAGCLATASTEKQGRPLCELCGTQCQQSFEEE